MTLARIHVIAAIITGVTLMICGGLVWVMGVEHDEWLERSYGNRWAFRDVPSRRGTISDRRGRVMRIDRPGVDLELRYWEFRRQHPIGTAVHGANLLLEAKGSDRRIAYDHPDTLPRACELLLATPCALLSTDPFSREQARDLRFYVYALLGSLTGLSSRWIIPPLLDAARREEQRSVLEVLRHSLASQAPAVRNFPDPQTAFGQRLAELRALGERVDQLGGLHGGATNLLSFLQNRMKLSDSWRRFESLSGEERDALRTAGFKSFLAATDGPAAEILQWQDWLDLDAQLRTALLETFAEQKDENSKAEFDSQDRFDTPPDEARPITLVRRIPYAQALWFGMQRERHPGWRLRPSVERAKGQDADLDSLASLVGRVTAAWRTDGKELLDDRVWRTLSTDSAAQFDAELESMPLPMENSLRDSRNATVRNYYRRSGRVGRSGIEQSLDDRLIGRPGLRLVERDRRFREQQMFQSMDVAPGKNVEMTIDVDLQSILESVLLSPSLSASPELAMAVVDARSGDILALGSRTRRGDALPQWSVGATLPMGNHIVGSVVKPFVLLEHLDALRRGRIAQDHRAFLQCERIYQRDVRGSIKKLECDGIHGVGSRDPVRALANSCNIFFFQAVEGLEIKGFRRALARVGWNRQGDSGFGFAAASYQDSILGLPDRIHSSPSLTPNRIVLQMQGIGYGVQVNTLQVARAYAGLATGRLPILSLVRGQEREGIPLDVDARDLEVVRAGLRACVLEGTAKRITDLRAGGIEVFGKTGTGEVNNKGDRNNAWFAGFVGSGEHANIAFAAVAYAVQGHGADVGGRMVADFLQQMTARGLGEFYLQR